MVAMSTEGAEPRVALATAPDAEIAARIGAPSSVRAVAQACGANVLAVAIPCHRVVSKSGMGGFMHHSGGYALDIKRWLLAHEGVTNQNPSFPRRRESSPIKALDSGSSPE